VLRDRRRGHFGQHQRPNRAHGDRLTKGQSRVTFDKMVSVDVRYALTQSLWFDLKILMQTRGAAILGLGAY
jgi:lipopolysaccharide/colanic/teichoic acid biosynthesis glycosyltransferase